MIEEWRDIVGYEGIYKISNIGRVKSLDRLNSRGFKINGRMLKIRNSRLGYPEVHLFHNGKDKLVKVHRLVASAFVPNPENKAHVNHLDEKRDNNVFYNLQWVTSKENNNYGTHNQKVAKANSIPIKVIYRDNTYECWESGTVFAKEHGFNSTSVSAVLKGKQKTAYGYKFEYAKK